MKDLTKGNITKLILWFALPVFVGNLFNQAYNLADTRIIGSYLGNDALAAVGSVGTLSDLFVNFIVGLANGFAVVTARHFGIGDRDRVRRTFGASISTGLCITVVIMAFSLGCLPLLLKLINVSQDHMAVSTEYISVILAGLIFTCLYNVMAASLRAIGDAFTPLLFLIFSACLNVGLDILFVGFIGIGVRGAAVATVLSQALSVLICFFYTWLRYPELRLKLQDLLPTRRQLSEMLPAGFSMGLMSCLVAFGTLTLQSAINTLGTNTIVAHSATRKLSSVYMMPFGALGTTMATFAGQNYGAGRLDRVKSGLKQTLLISYVYCIFLQILTYTVYPSLIVAVTDTSIAEVIETATLYQKVNVLFYVICPTICILRNTLQGIGDHVTPIISSGLELLGKLVIALVFTPVFAYWAIIMSEPVVWVIMVIPLIISMYKRLKNIAIT